MMSVVHKLIITSLHPNNHKPANQLTSNQGKNEKGAKMLTNIFQRSNFQPYHDMVLLFSFVSYKRYITAPSHTQLNRYKGT